MINRMRYFPLARRLVTRSFFGVALRLVPLCALLLSSSPPADAASVGPSILTTAETMTEACLTHARDRKFPPISMAVVDAGGHLIVFKRQDGASIASGEVAVLKAKTAAMAHAPTAALGQLAEQDVGMRGTLSVLGLTGIPGGVPFDLGRQPFQGAIGVSGGAVEQDTACAAKAIAAVAAIL